MNYSVGSRGLRDLANSFGFNYKLFKTDTSFPFLHLLRHSEGDRRARLTVARCTNQRHSPRNEEEKKTKAALSSFLSFSIYPPKITLGGVLFPGFRGGGLFRTSNRTARGAPLSQKLISLNIILGASGSRRALTTAAVPLPPRASLRPPPLHTALFSLLRPSSSSSSFNFLMRKCFQRAGEKYCVYER